MSAMEAFAIYVRALQRDPPAFPVARGVEAVPRFFEDCAKWTVFFTGLMLLAPQMAKALAPRWYKQLDSRKKAEFPPYAVSMIHHVIVVPYGWYYFFQDIIIPNYANGMVDYSHFLEFLTPILGAFVVADTLCYALPESVLHNHHEYLIHHVLAILLFVPFLYGPGALVRYYPHLVICETTNLLFNIAWLLRLAGFRTSPAVTICEVLFAIVFFFTRFINLTIVFSKIFLSEEGVAMGPFRYLLPPILVLQWYWMGKIVQALLRKFGGGAPSGEQKKE